MVASGHKNRPAFKPAQYKHMSIFHYVNLPVADMRMLPSRSSEVVSQAYFSEQVKIITEDTGWTKIETIIDGYQGWTPSSALFSRRELYLESPENISAIINRCAAHLYAAPDTIYGPLLTLPFESRLQVIDPGEEPNSRWIKLLLVDGREAYVQRGDIALNSNPIKRNEICSFSQRFIGLPYTWGGRSSFGYDCSGFVQMLYRQMGIYLPRDAKDQIRWHGFQAIPVEDMISGSLIFFGSQSDLIRHVGMYLGKDQFIHATVSENAPYIHVSQLSDPEWSGSGKWTYRAARTLC